jgi:L-threonylcarbamoyladenylate synthase
MHEPMSPGFEARRVLLGREHGDLLARLLPEMRRGGVVLLPTDTIYGLSCRWDSDRARERIQAIKGPGRLALFVALVANSEMAFQFAQPPGFEGQRILDEQWPGPLTAVLRARPEVVPPFCLGPEGTIAFRWPRDAFLQELVRDLGVPLVSTSANRTGAPNVADAREAWEQFGAGIDLYVDGGRRPGLPSTLVDLTVEKPRLLRLGIFVPSGVDVAAVDRDDRHEPHGSR